MKLIYILPLLLLIAIVGCSEASREKKDDIVRSGSTGTDIDKIQLTDLENQDINLNRYKGKTIFVNFWATWCKPCVEEMPSIQKLQTLIKDENIIFLFASDEELSDIQGFKNDNNYAFNYTRIINQESLGIQALPTTSIYNPDGKLVFSEPGYRNWDDSANIRMILKIINQK